MTYRDFGPALTILGTRAPNLRSLAVHGLELPAGALFEFAEGCPLLSRVHFVHCTLDSEGLRGFLRRTLQLRDILLWCDTDVSDVALDEWLDERMETPSAVQPRSIVVPAAPGEDELAEKLDDEPGGELLRGFACKGLAEDVDDVGPEMLFVPTRLLATKLPLIRAGAFKQLTKFRAMWNPLESLAPHDAELYETAAAVARRWRDVYEFAATGQLRLFHNLFKHPHGRRGIYGKPRVPRNVRDHKLHELLGVLAKIDEKVERMDRMKSELEHARSMVAAGRGRELISASATTAS